MSVWSRSIVFCCFISGLVGGLAKAELYINEIMFDPPGGLDSRYEYVELRGTPNMTLEDHYLIFIENEDTFAGNGPAGQIDNIFDLGAHTVGGNGFLTFLQKFHLYSLNPAANNQVNAGGSGQSGFGSGATSTIGHTDSSLGESGETGRIENGGFTAALIRNVEGTAPTVNFDLDVGNNGLDITPENSATPENPNGWWGQTGWELIDAIGVHPEFDESDFGVLYAPVNFGGGLPLPGGTPISGRLPVDAEYFETGYEIELIARWGNSTGQTVADWHATNVTDNAATGSSGIAPDWRQAGDQHPPAPPNNSTPPGEPTEILESSKGVPYGTKIMDTVGSPNYIFGDYNGDGYVDAADYTVWRDTLGQTGTSSDIPAADHDHNYVVDQADYDIWRANFGAPNSTPPAALLDPGDSTVPEPTSFIIGIGLLMGAFSIRRLA